MKKGRIRATICATAMLAAILAVVPACTSGGSSTITVPQETMQGILQSLQGSQLTIKLDDGRTATLVVTEQQATLAQPLVGNQIKVMARESTDGKTREAEKIESRGQKGEFTGTVQSMSATSWTVSDKTFSVNVNTEIKASIGVGSMVKVEYITLSDGKLMATDIELAQGEERTQTPPPSGTVPPSGTGAQLYSTFCSSCHGASRQGATGPALTPARIAGDSDSEIAKTISEGEDSMPGFARQLTSQQINSIVQFLRSPLITTTATTTTTTTATPPATTPPPTTPPVTTPPVTTPPVTTPPPTTTTVAAVSFSAVIQPILAASCVSCHGPGGAAGINVSTYAGVGATVTPGNATTSLLYRSLTGSGAVLMPPGASLSAAQIQQFAAWINQGALNN